MRGAECVTVFTRFKTDGRYRPLELIDFCHNSLRSKLGPLKRNVWYALYADNYSTMTIFHHNREEMLYMAMISSSVVKCFFIHIFFLISGHCGLFYGIYG